jgi:hypothetical protein
MPRSARLGRLASAMTPTAASPDPDTWHPARLIPTAGIRGQEEQERRATSCLLAVMGAVTEFGRALIADVGGPKGRVTTYTEVQLKDIDGKLSIPDGVAVVERGKRSWRCLIEVKTSGAPLKPEQVNRYLDMARQHGFDAVVTISNQITSSTEECPVDVDKRKTKSVALRHLSWWRIVTEAVVQHRHHGIADPDQAWILGELIAYLDHEASGAGGFHDMGDKWVSVRNAAREGTLRAADPGAFDVAEKWEQFVGYLCLGLSQDLGREVKVVRRRRDERIEGVVKRLAETGKLSASVRVPDAVGPINVEADLRTQRLTTSVTVDAPEEGRPQTRMNWMLRQLREAPDDLRIDVSFVSARETISALLKDAREYPGNLLSAADPKREPRSFTLALARAMGTKRGKGERSFVRETRQQAVDFYRSLVQNLRAWQRMPPKLPDEPQDEVLETPVPTPPPFSADEREVGQATDPAVVMPGQRPKATP